MKKQTKVVVVLLGIAVVTAAFLCGRISGIFDKKAAAISIIGGADGPTSIFLTGKVGENSDHDAAQELYTRSLAAREYADERIQEYLAPFNSDYQIQETSYGFYTSETPVYVVGYRCRNGAGGTLNYGCKLHVNDDLTCRILEEGEGVAAFLFEEQ